MVFCTVNDMEKAKIIARNLVSDKLCACVNIIPQLISVYCWKNNIEQDDEILLIIKTRKELFNKLKVKIVELHPYDVPEVICTEIKDGNEQYLNWICENTIGGSSS